MAGVAGNVFTLAFAKQTVKGTAASAASGYKLKVTGGDVAPDRSLLTLQETDASRQQGQTVVVAAKIMGTPEMYVRPSNFGLLALATLGTDTVTGAGPFTHTITPLNTGLTPYLTIWKNIGAGLIIDKYTDNRLSTLEISGGAGQAITAKVDVMGLGALFGTTDNSTAVVTENAYTYPQAAVSLGGSVPNTVEQFTLSLNNNADFIQADNNLGPYDVVHGRLEVTGSFTYLLQSDADYRSFHTGSSGGTAMSTTLFQQAIAMTISDGTNIINPVMLGAAYTGYPVPPDVSGKPIRVAATFTSLPQAAVSDYIKIIVTNGVATY